MIEADKKDAVTCGKTHRQWSTALCQRNQSAMSVYQSFLIALRSRARGDHMDSVQQI